MKKALLLYIPPMSEIPTSLAMVSAIFKERGFEVKSVVNAFRRPLSTQDFLDIADDYKPDIVGISMLTMQVPKTYEVVRGLKERGYPVIAGGTHVTCCDVEAVENGVDIVVRNEGEHTLRDLLSGFYPSTIRGITYRDHSGKIVRNPDSERIKDLSSIPLPDFSSFDLDLFRIEDGTIKGLNRIYTSRGCPGRCTFCDYQVFGQKVAYVPMTDIAYDIQRRVDNYGIRKFIIADDCFTVNRNHVRELCDVMKSIKPSITWQGWSRVDTVTPEILSMLKDAGCYMVVFGVESGDPETLKRTNKGTTREKNIRAVKMAHAARLQVGVNLMFGFPWETIESLNNTLSLVYELWNYTHLFNGSGSIVPFPGTQIYREYVEECGFKDYWLNPRFQDCGVSLYQNAENPYSVSTLSQRFMYDDTYIQEEYFFKYSLPFMKRMSEVAYEIGRHNLETMYPRQPLKQKVAITACKLSKALYERFPNLEKGVGKLLTPHKRPAIEEKRFAIRGMVGK
jgi:anaerobic magnesium-protoporphyrin IX monomethyl ester cyclase